MKKYRLGFTVYLTAEAEDITDAVKIGEEIASRLEWEALHTSELVRPYTVTACLDSTDPI